MIILQTTDSKEMFIALQDVVKFSYGFKNKTFTIKRKWWNKHYSEIMDAIGNIPFQLITEMPKRAEMETKQLFKPLEIQ